MHSGVPINFQFENQSKSEQDTRIITPKATSVCALTSTLGSSASRSKMFLPKIPSMYTYSCKKPHLCPSASCMCYPG